MSTELRPLGVKCNIACQYCYQHSQRDVEIPKRHYDMEKMKKGVAREGGPFTLFGGEALLIPRDDLEELFSWGYQEYGGSFVQTNGTLITDDHIDMFRRLNVAVGISVDGPGELNDIRWAHSLENTRRQTAATQANIQKLCEAGLHPGIIVTLHRQNALPEHFSRMASWIRGMDDMGIKSMRLHLMEVDSQDVKEHFMLTPDENVEAMLFFHKLEKTLKSLRFDLFSEIESLLQARDDITSCVWNACDPYTTSAVRGVEGDGKRTNCGRTNKDGVDYLKADLPFYGRYIALYNTPQEDNGCRGCRFFSMCKGQCPGTAIHGDWRNRTEHCAVWKKLFELKENEMLEAGLTPLSRHDMLSQIEEMQQLNWRNGKNISLRGIVSYLERNKQESGNLICCQ